MVSDLIFNIQKRSGSHLRAVIIQIKEVIKDLTIWTNSKRDKIDISERTG